jgi:membrane protease YdiL (CAAX protease family)
MLRRIGYALAATAAVVLCTDVVGLWSRPFGPSYWLFDGPGGGVLRELVPSLVLIAIGIFVFKLSVREQWGGSFAFTRRALGYGALVGVGASVLTIGLAAATGVGSLYFDPPWSAYGVNVFSNLYEEILVRGLLLQVIRRRWSDRAAMIWSSVIFGAMHGFGPKGVFIMLTSWTMAWAVLRARSLWAGWVCHQVSDVIIDSVLH